MLRRYLGRKAVATIALAAGAIMVSDLAHAAAARYVSAAGNDANQCTRMHPCLTLQRGVDVVAIGGVVVVLDSGLYGAVSITKSVTITAPEGVAAVVSNVTIATPSIEVLLHGLHLNGKGSGTTGVRVAAAASLRIEHCIIERFAGNGIEIAVGPSHLAIADTMSRNNGGSGLILGGGASADISIERSRFENNGGDGARLVNSATIITDTLFSRNQSNGLSVTGGTTDIRDAQASHNVFDGFIVGVGSATIVASTGSRNGRAGLQATLSGSIRASESSFSHNVDGFRTTTGGVIETLGDNIAKGNSVTVNGALTPVGGI